METLTLLRRLAEQHNYSALRGACLEVDFHDPDVQVLSILADVQLGDTSAGRRALSSLERAALSLDARVDLASIYMVLGELEVAVAILEAAQQENADHALLLARLAWCRQQQGNRDGALMLYQRSLRLRPLLAVYENLLNLLRDSGRLAEMAACLDAAWRFWNEEQNDWPDDQRQIHGARLRDLQLDLWMSQELLEAAEAWVEEQRHALNEGDWCALVAGLAQRLSGRDRHAQAEEWLRAALRFYPENIALYGEHANLTSQLGRPLQAITLLRQAIRLSNAHGKSTESLWIRLSAIAKQFDSSLAREAVERAREQLSGAYNANEMTEGSLQVDVALAAIDSHDEKYVVAERRYRAVLEQRPDLVPALEGLGQLCMQLGRIDEAVALFERVKLIDPARGHGALINARRFPDDETTLQRLEQLARTPGMEGSVRTGLLFQLAAAWERRADYARAFALANEANAVARRLLRYDPKAHHQRSARIRHAFPKALYEHRAGFGHESTLPVFVVGMPRSGTTLVEQILAGHSRIHGAGELGTIPRVIAGLERWERHTGSARCYPDCVDDLDPNVTRGIADSILTELREAAPDADHVVDKLPHNFENVGLIKLLFPHARIISVRRDPRDIAISNYFIEYAMRHGDMGFAYDLEWIGEQLADHSLLMDHWQEVFPGEILEIRYEDLVESPAAIARRMLDYVGVDWESQVLDFHALERPVRTSSVWQVRQPLYSTSIGRWRHYRQYLEPLIAGTRRLPSLDPIEMVTLPEPGWLNVGVDRYHAGDLDAAEYRFKRLLNYVPEHAAARFMLGLVYVRKGHRDDGISLMELALERCPWNRHWRRDLARAYSLSGRHEGAAALANNQDVQVASPPVALGGEKPPMQLAYVLPEESTCRSSESAVIGVPC